MYANSLDGALLLDDQRTLVDNTSIRQLSSLAQVLRPPTQMPVTGRPLVNLSFAINYAFGGLSLPGYHVGNIAVHVLAGLALFGLLSTTFARLAGRSAFGITAAAVTPLALVGSLLWMVHPLNSESVNYLTQRTESMMGLFYLTSLYAAARGLRDPVPGRRSAGTDRAWALLAVAAAFASVACKETALTLPFVLVLWDRCFGFDSWRAAWTARWRLYAAVATSWMLFIVFARELPYFAEGGFREEVSRWDYLLHQGPIIVSYLRLVIWPRGLVFDYGAPGPVAWAQVWPAVSMVAVLGVLALIALWRSPRVGFWGAWFFITLAPASSLIPIPTEVGAERRMYLPLVAVLVLLMLAGYALLQRLPVRAARVLRVALPLALIAALGAGTAVRNRDYTDGLRIWNTVLERRPHTRAHEHMSMFLRDAGRIEESMSHLTIAAPHSAEALHALASARLERGDVAGALADYRAFVERYPSNRHIIEAREAYGLTLLNKGDSAAAAEQFRAIVALNANYARGRVALASALSNLGDQTGARAQYAEAVRIQPHNLLALVNLGLLEAAAGEHERAIATLRRAIAVQPAELVARRRLLGLLLERQQFAEMETEARELVRYAPNDSDAHNLLGIALASQQRYGPAKEAFAAAVRMDPANVQARNNLERLR